MSLKHTNEIFKYAAKALKAIDRMISWLVRFRFSIRPVRPHFCRAVVWGARALQRVVRVPRDVRRMAKDAEILREGRLESALISRLADSGSSIAAMLPLVQGFSESLELIYAKIYR